MQGTLLSRYIRCGKKNCRCASDPAKRHGPYWYLVWRAGEIPLDPAGDAATRDHAKAAVELRAGAPWLLFLVRTGVIDEELREILS